MQIDERTAEHAARRIDLDESANIGLESLQPAPKVAQRVLLEHVDRKRRIRECTLAELVRFVGELLGLVETACIEGKESAGREGVPQLRRLPDLLGKQAPSRDLRLSRHDLAADQERHRAHRVAGREALPIADRPGRGAQFAPEREQLVGGIRCGDRVTARAQSVGERGRVAGPSSKLDRLSRQCVAPLTRRLVPKSS